MSKKILLFCIFITLTSTTILPQGRMYRAVWFSAHSGFMLSSKNNIEDTYDSKAGFVYGIGAGLPVSGRTYIYGKATWFSLSGTPVVENWGYRDDEWTLLESHREGKAEYSQWLINAGMLVNLYRTENWAVGINGGLSWSSIEEKKSSVDGNITSGFEGSGVIGTFAGLTVERNIFDNRFTVFAEPQYNFTFETISGFVGNYGGLNMNIGIRFYIGERIFK